MQNTTDQAIKLKTEHLNQQLADMEKHNAEAKLPFYKRIQLPDNLDQLKRIEYNLRWAFEGTIRKHNPELIPEWQDLFASFMTEFLNGGEKNIWDWKQKMGIKATKNKHNWGCTGQTKEELEA